MLHNQTHTIVHSSAMYYQNLIIIHECSKKLLKVYLVKNARMLALIDLYLCMYIACFFTIWLISDMYIATAIVIEHV